MILKKGNICQFALFTGMLFFGSCQPDPSFNYRVYKNEGGNKIISSEGNLDSNGLPNGLFNIYLPDNVLWSGYYKNGLKSGPWNYEQEGKVKSDIWIYIESGEMQFSLPKTWLDIIKRQDDSTLVAESRYVNSEKTSGGLVIGRRRIPNETTFYDLFQSAKERFDSLGFKSKDMTREFGAPFELTNINVAALMPSDSARETRHILLLYQLSENEFLEIFRTCLDTEFGWNSFLVSEVFYDFRIKNTPIVNRWEVEDQL
ncbi:MAG: hypothetical protein GC193_10500 [Cryomorphaceae bacterium]|nr:hypothetical protein [Cryomorphaceae bacterium]